MEDLKLVLISFLLIDVTSNALTRGRNLHKKG